MPEHGWHVIGFLVVVIAPVLIIMAMQAYDRRAEARASASEREKGADPQGSAPFRN